MHDAATVNYRRYFLSAPDKQFSVKYLDLVEDRLLFIWVCDLPVGSVFGMEVRLLDTSTGGVVGATRKLLHLRATVALSLSGRNSRSRTWISCFKSVIKNIYIIGTGRALENTSTDIRHFLSWLLM